MVIPIIKMCSESYLYDGNPYFVRQHLYIETTPNIFSDFTLPIIYAHEKDELLETEVTIFH